MKLQGSVLSCLFKFLEKNCKVCSCMVQSVFQAAERFRHRYFTKVFRKRFSGSCTEQRYSYFYIIGFRRPSMLLLLKIEFKFNDLRVISIRPTLVPAFYENQRVSSYSWRTTQTSYITPKGHILLKKRANVSALKDNIIVVSRMSRN